VIGRRTRELLLRRGSVAPIVVRSAIGASLLIAIVGCSKKVDESETRSAAAASSREKAAGEKKDPPPSGTIITKADCERWALHGVSVLIGTVKTAAAECPADSRDAIVARFEGQRLAMRDGAIKTCEAHLDEPYTAAQGQCYLQAKTAIELRACGFAPMIAEGDSDPEGLVTGIRATCEKMKHAPGSGSAPPRAPAGKPRPTSM
jgi:hypothetical protein